MRYTQRDEEAYEMKQHVDSMEYFVRILHRLDLSDEYYVDLTWQASVRHAVYKIHIHKTGHKIERVC